MLRRNVLIFQTGGLGDFVLTWPFAVALARIFPQSRMTYITHSQKGELARRVLRLESADLEIGWHGLFAEQASLTPAVLKLIESAHSIYTFLPVNSVWRENVLRHNPQARIIEIQTTLTPDFAGHLTDQILESLSQHAPEKSATEQILRSIQDRGIGFKLTPGKEIVIHPGSGSPSKCWPLDRYLELSNRLIAMGRKVRFLIGEVELERYTPAEVKQLEAIAPLKRCNSYLELLSELATAGVFVSNDTGPSHLAGIIGAATVAIFGPTDPTQWKPLGPKVRVVQAESLATLPVDRVLNAACELWDTQAREVSALPVVDAGED